MKPRRNPPGKDARGTDAPPVARHGSAVAALSLRQLGYVVALSETLNFTRAAARCFVTQSTLSAGIRELERQLDVVLFERDRQSVRLSAPAHDLVARARILLSQAQDLIQAARSAGAPLQGSVTLGAIPTIAPFLLPPLLRRMRAELPQLSVLLREEQTARLLEELEQGAIDAALIALPMDVGQLHAVPLFEEELWLIASEHDPLAALQLPRVGQIEMGRLLLLSDGHCLRDHSLKACQQGRRGRGRNPSAIEATSLPTLVQMVEAGLGVSLLPEMAVRAGFLVGSTVIARPLAAPAPKREIALVSRPTSSRGALLDRIGALATAIAQERPAGARRSRVARPAPGRRSMGTPG